MPVLPGCTCSAHLHTIHRLYRCTTIHTSSPLPSTHQAVFLEACLKAVVESAKLHKKKARDPDNSCWICGTDNDVLKKTEAKLDRGKATRHFRHDHADWFEWVQCEHCDKWACPACSPAAYRHIAGCAERQ